jgi:hypothetical protein
MLMISESSKYVMILCFWRSPSASLASFNMDFLFRPYVSPAKRPKPAVEDSFQQQFANELGIFFLKNGPTIANARHL